MLKFYNLKTHTMIFIQNFLYTPGGENESGTDASHNNEDKAENSPLPSEINDDNEDKPVVEKIKEALQDWSNKDQADQEFDDTRV